MSYKRVGMKDRDRQWQYVQVWRDLAKLLRAFVTQTSADLLPRKVSHSILELTEVRHTVTLTRLGANAITGTNAFPGPGTATYRAPQ